MGSHLGEPARLTGPAHFHMNSTLYSLYWSVARGNMRNITLGNKVITEIDIIKVNTLHKNGVFN